MTLKGEFAVISRKKWCIFFVVATLGIVGLFVSAWDSQKGIPTVENTTEVRATIQRVDVKPLANSEMGMIYTQEDQLVWVIPREKSVNWDTLINLQPGQVIFFRHNNTPVDHAKKAGGGIIVSIRTEENEIKTLESHQEYARQKNKVRWYSIVIWVLLCMLIFLRQLLLSKVGSIYRKLKLWKDQGKKRISDETNSEDAEHQ